MKIGRGSIIGGAPIAGLGVPRHAELLSAKHSSGIGVLGQRFNHPKLATQSSRAPLYRIRVGLQLLT